MFNKKQLTLVNPVITAHGTVTHINAIIRQSDKSLPWINSNFIQLEYGDADLLDFHMPLIERHCPFIKYQKIERKLIKLLKIDLIDFFINCLNLDQYVFISVNRYFMPPYEFFYNKINRDHGPIIFGYDTEKKTFDIADYFGGKYSFKKVSFSEIYEGYSNVVNENSAVEIFEFNHDADYSFNINNVVNYLSDYVESRNSHQRLGIYYNQPQWNYGLEVYQKLEDVLNEILYKNRSDFRDRRSFHLFWLHKHLMFKRLIHLEESFLIRSGRSDAYKIIESNAMLIKNIYLKYLLTKQNNLLNKIIELLKITQIEEQSVLLNVLNDLDKSPNPEDNINR